MRPSRVSQLRAEALLEVIHAGSERAWRLAQANLGGRLGDEARALERRALGVLAEIEGAIDFPEDDLELDADADIDRELGALAAACGRLAAGFRHGRAVSRGIAVALVGAVNVGKSSLLNALVGRERALVGAAPGTTRDWLEVTDVWNGVAVTLIDTAGLRTTDDPVEQRGIALGEARVASADVVLVVNDGIAAWDDGARFGDRAVVIRSKADLGGEPGAGLPTSAATGSRRPHISCGEGSCAMNAVNCCSPRKTSFLSNRRRWGSFRPPLTPCSGRTWNCRWRTSSPGSSRRRPCAHRGLSRPRQLLSD